MWLDAVSQPYLPTYLVLEFLSEPGDSTYSHPLTTPKNVLNLKKMSTSIAETDLRMYEFDFVTVFIPARRKRLIAS